MDGSINFSGTLLGSIADRGTGIQDVQTNASGEYESVVDEQGIAKIDLSNYATDAELESAVNNINSELSNYATDEQLESAVNTINSVLLTKQNKIDFSIEEQNTGRKWVDGKSIYQKTYLNVNLSNNQDTVLDSNASTMQLLSYVIDFCGIPNTLTKHIENTSDTLYIDNRGLIYYINRTTSWWNELNKANITIYYTKSED